jgi:uncharacterized zinc-type alcohol dehydrogenase-like protein
MTTVQAYAAPAAGARLESFEYTLPEIGPREIDIEVISCGICHSDLSMIDNEWGFSAYPLVGGHEVIGRVAATGPDVTSVAVGDLVGLGWHAGYCMTCPQCMSGHHNTCARGEMTIVGRHGGFADRVRAREGAVIRLPDGIDTAKAGPLLCGGVTVFNPIATHVRPTDRVAVVGIGGLGHMALKFLKAWGCEVTAFTSSEGKRNEALALGATDTIDSRDPGAIAAAAGRFDLILSTVNVPLDWNAYVAALAPRGRLHSVGAVPAPFDFQAFPFLMGERSFGGNPVGAPVMISDMLAFAARHGILPETEHYAMSDINDALDHLRAGKARYRIVLDAS